MYKIIPAAYIFTHVYLNTMQQGIQSLHVVGEFIAKYGPQVIDDDLIIPDQFADVQDWATNHKVVRILNAGGSPDFMGYMSEAFKLARDNKMPYVSFQEPDCFDQITAFGIIVTPEVVYNIESAREALGASLSPVERKIAEDSDPLVQFLMQFYSAR